MIPQIGMAAVDILVEAIDMPGAQKLIDRVKKLIPPELRDKEPGEPDQPQQQPPPDPKVIAEMQKMQVAMMEQQRKDQEEARKSREESRKNFEAIIGEAESKEQGSQIAQYTALANQLKAMVDMQQKMQQQPPTGGPA